MGAGNYARHDAQDRMGKSGFRLPGEICGMDARRKVATACFPGAARGQETEPGGAGKLVWVGIPRPRECAVRNDVSEGEHV